MALFRDKTLYDRAAALDAAAKFHGKGKHKKALVEYRKVLEHEPANAVIKGKVATLLAETGQLAEAWEAFVDAAEAYEKQGFDDKALAVYQQATSYMPLEVELWETIARKKVKKGRSADAIKTLLQGRKNFRKKKYRPFAVRLLQMAVEIEPFEFHATYDLAGLLAKDGGKEDARALLEGLAERTRRQKLRRVRGALFRLSPGPGTGWRWLRAALRGR